MTDRSFLDRIVFSKRKPEPAPMPTNVEELRSLVTQVAHRLRRGAAIYRTPPGIEEYWTYATRLRRQTLMGTGDTEEDALRDLLSKLNPLLE